MNSENNRTWSTTGRWWKHLSRGQKFAAVVGPLVATLALIIQGPKWTADSYEAMCTGPKVVTSIGLWLELDCERYQSMAAQLDSPAIPAAQIPLEEAFTVSPVSWGRDLTLTVRKARTAYKGNIVVFSCNPATGHYREIGVSAFGSASDSFIMGDRYEADSIVIGINVRPEDGDTKTVISPWDLKNLRRTKPPEARQGELQCLDFAGEH